MARYTPSGEATIGPFFPERYVDALANDLTTLDGKAARGAPIEIVGRVTQEDGAPLHNLVLEVWQADANGIFRHPADPRAGAADENFYGWGRAATDRDGRYSFRTIKPGTYAMPDGTPRAPHINVLIVFSGIMRQLQTVLFFEGESRNDTDPVLTSVSPAALRARLIAKRETPTRYRFDVRLRGAEETPFFDD
jgi:protocatechuate 3,4-dioxygenase alpha subunit